jgi:hypothetical protein
MQVADNGLDQSLLEIFSQISCFVDYFIWSSERFIKFSLLLVFSFFFFFVNIVIYSFYLVIKRVSIEQLEVVVA